MKKVFAVLFLVLLLSGCRSTNMVNKEKPVSFVDDNSILTISYDFNKDGRNETIKLIKTSNDGTLIRYADKNRISYTEFPTKCSNFNYSIEDTDGDGYKDLIIFEYFDNAQYIDVFNVKNSIKLVFSSRDIASKVSIKSLYGRKQLCFGELKSNIINIRKLKLNMYFTDTDSDLDRTQFISEGTLTSGKDIIYTVSLTYSLHDSFILSPIDISLKPYSVIDNSL
jgi:hypothetical protein